jgi:hypothetical protein
MLPLPKSAEAAGEPPSDREPLRTRFWQNRHARLQPAVPKDSTAVPGRKWFRGFFSMGSTQNPDERP